MDYNSKKTNTIYDILWELATLEFSFESSEFRQEITTLIWMFFREVKIQSIQLDPEWVDFTKHKGSLSGEDRSYYDNM